MKRRKGIGKGKGIKGRNRKQRGEGVAESGRRKRMDISEWK